MLNLEVSPVLLLKDSIIWQYNVAKLNFSSAINLSGQSPYNAMEDFGAIVEVLERWKVSGELELRKLTGLNINSWRDYFKQEITEIDSLLDSAAEDAHERLATLLSFAVVVARVRPFVAAPLLRYFSDIKGLIHKLALNLGVNDTEVTIGFPFTIEMTFNIPTSKPSK